jgi:predicted nucleic acid-binding protein
MDASAIVKLIVQEAESPALRADVAARPALITSRLGTVEAERAVRRAPRPPLVQMRAVIDTVDVIELSPSLMTHAASLAPAELRTLDAIHLATLLLLGAAELDVITYDERLAAAARQHGFTVWP